MLYSSKLSGLALERDPVRCSIVKFLGGTLREGRAKVLHSGKLPWAIFR